jgi:hypothetical protein
MRQVPRLLWADDLRDYKVETLLPGQLDGTNERWVLARPLSFKQPLSFVRRLKLAIKVFKGECDALQWSDQ